MYVPHKFRMSDEQVVNALRGAGLAVLMTPGDDGLLVTPLPLRYHPDRNTLRGHMARANPHWRQVRADVVSTAIFAGRDGYISPSWYATKTETGKVVPTWDYEIVCVHGRLSVHDDPDWLREQVSDLTDRHERDRDPRWSVSDAPDDFVDAQLTAIVGVELAITRWEGKAKMSQNQPRRNQESVVAALAASSDRTDQLLAERIADYVSE